MVSANGAGAFNSAMRHECRQPTGADELENADGDATDDIMVWLSPNILYNRMIAAGKLP
jgi:hypothetical protein